MPSSEPQEIPMSGDQQADPRSGAKALAASLVILLAGGLTMFAVSRGAPGVADLPRLPPLDGNSRAGAESLTIAAGPLPSSLASGVVAPADEAPAYRLTGGGRVDDVVAVLAKALGIESGPESRRDERGALIADAGSDRVLRVENSPGYPWSLMRGDIDCFDNPDSSVSSDGSIACPSATGSAEPGPMGGAEPSQGAVSSESRGATSGAGEEARCEPVECPAGQACAQVCPEPELIAPVAEPEPFVQLPNPQDTEARARSIFQSLGLEIARSTVSVAPDGRAWQVLAELSVEGIPVVGMDTQLSFGGGGEVVAGSGMLPGVDLLGAYPLITAGEALTRLQQIHSPNVQPHFDGREPAVGAPEPAVAPDFASVPPADPTEVTGLRLVLLLQASGGGPRGGSYLVPAFLVDTSDGSVFTVPAATDEHLTPT
jgi:hypothetical protein